MATPTPSLTAKRQRIPCLPLFTRYIYPITHSRVDDRRDVAHVRQVYFMMIYIERELAENIDLDSIIDEFYSIKYRRV